jgi:hypothetical protein
MVTLKGSISTGRESLKFLLYPERRGVLPGFTARRQSWRNMAWTGNKKSSVSWNLPKLSQLWRCKRGFGPHTTQNHLRTKQFVSGTWISSRVAACALRNEQAATLLEFHVPLTNCFVRRWFCVVRGPKPLHHHNWPGFGKFQDTERFRIPCPRHVSSWLPPSGETCNYAKEPRTQKKTQRYSLPIDMLPFGVTIPATVSQRSQIPEGLMSYPVLSNNTTNRARIHAL